MLCTAQLPLGLPNERVFDVLPLQPEDAARLFKDIALEALPHELRPLSAPPTLALTLTLTLTLTLALTLTLTLTLTHTAIATRRASASL